MGRQRPATHEQIAALAHELWQERGCPAGSDVDIWLEAERELNGAPPEPRRDHIPASGDAIDPDHDPAVNPPIDREIESIHRAPPDNGSPTGYRLF